MKSYLAELLASFIMVFCGTGAMVVNDVFGGVIGHLGIALAFGFIIMAMIYAYGDVSGAHMNPAVTLAFWVSGRFERNKVLPYLMSQFSGALLASLLLHVLYPAHSTLGATLPQDALWRGMIIEFIFSFILMAVILQVAHGSKETGVMAGFAIGMVVMIAALVGGPICGASMNPARSLGPALVSGHLEYLWLYFVFPVAGTASAALFFRLSGTKAN